MMRSELKFTSSESFRLFASGIEALQAYERKAELETLGKAERDLGYCESHYPQDVLPRFYLGVVKALRGGPGLDDAQRLFQDVLDAQITELKAPARFNLAWTRLERYSDEDLALAESEVTSLLSDLASQEPSEAVDDLKLQAEAMLVFLFVRQRLWRKRKEGVQGSVLANGQQQLGALKARIDAARLPKGSKDDLLAEYYNISGLLKESQAWSQMDAKAKASLAREAGRDFEEALGRKINWLPAMQNRARVMIELQNENDGARSLLEKALRTSPNVEYSHYLLGQVCEAKGETKAAIGHYEKAASSPEARAALQRLRSTPSSGAPPSTGP